MQTVLAVLSDCQPLLVKARTTLAAKFAVCRAVSMRLMVAAALTLPAFAGETGSGSGNSSGGSSDLSAVIDSVDTISSMVNKAWDMMIANPLVRVSLAAGLLSMGVGFLAFLRRAARH